jgi:hypothetical protein
MTLVFMTFNIPCAVKPVIGIFDYLSRPFTPVCSGGLAELIVVYSRLSGLSASRFVFVFSAGRLVQMRCCLQLRLCGSPTDKLGLWMLEKLSPLELLR